MLLSLAAPTYAEQSNYLLIKNVVSEWKYGKYVLPLESTIPTFSNEKLEEVLTNVRTASMKSQQGELHNFLKFIENLILEEMLDRVMWDVEESNETSTYEQLSPEEMIQVEKSILSLQTNLTDSLSDLLDELIVLWNDSNHYEEKWDFSMDMDVNIQNFLKYSIGLQINDYLAETQWLDATFSSSSELDILMKNVYQEEEMEMGINTNIDLIVKGGEYYVSVKDTNIEGWETILPVNFKEILSKIQELSSDNTYIKISDENAQAGIEMLKNFSSWNIENTLLHFSQTPLFEAYGKTDTAYLLRPTQDFCSYVKEVTAIFDPFNGSDCSKNQYSDMLDELDDIWLSLELMIGKNNTLSFKVDNKSDVLWNVDINYSDYWLISIKGNILEPGNEEVNNINFSFIPKDSLYFESHIENSIDILMDAKLSRDSSLSSMNVEVLIEEAFNIKSQYSHWDFTLSAYWTIDDENIDCKAQWDIHTDFVDIDGTCSITSTDYFSGEDEVFLFNGHLWIDTQSQKNNVDMDITATMNNEELFSVLIKNVGTKASVPQRDITAPKKHIDLEEFMDEVSSSTYSDTYEIESLNDEDYYYEDCYEYEWVEYCDIESSEYYYDAYSNIYYYDDYEYDANTWEYLYYDEF